MFSVINSSNKHFNNSSSLNKEHHGGNQIRHEHLPLEDRDRVIKMISIYEENTNFRFDLKRITLNVGGVRHGESHFQTHIQT